MEKTISRIRVIFTSADLTGSSTGFASVKASGVYMSKGSFLHHIMVAKGGGHLPGPTTIHSGGKQVRNVVDYGHFVQLYF